MSLKNRNVDSHIDSIYAKNTPVSLFASINQKQKRKKQQQHKLGAIFIDGTNIVAIITKHLQHNENGKTHRLFPSCRSSSFLRLPHFNRQTEMVEWEREREREREANKERNKKKRIQSVPVHGDFSHKTNENQRSVDAERESERGFSIHTCQIITNRNYG